MISFKCPKCQKIGTAQESQAGKVVNCQFCGQNLQVPKAAPAPVQTPVQTQQPHTTTEIVVVRCSACQTTLQVPSTHSGETWPCIKCGQNLTIPYPQKPSPLTVASPPPVRHEDRRDDRQGPGPADYGRQGPGLVCPFCKSSNVIVEQKMSQNGLIVLIAMLFLCFPFFWIGLLMKEPKRKCLQCGMAIG